MCIEHATLQIDDPRFRDAAGPGRSPVCVEVCRTTQHGKVGLRFVRSIQPDWILRRHDRSAGARLEERFGQRSPPRKASGKESGSFLKKRTKKLLQIQA
jgi:hypothetical protein